MRVLWFFFYSLLIFFFYKKNQVEQEQELQEQELQELELQELAEQEQQNQQELAELLFFFVVFVLISEAELMQPWNGSVGAFDAQSSHVSQSSSW